MFLFRQMQRVIKGGIFAPRSKPSEVVVKCWVRCTSSLSFQNQSRSPQQREVSVLKVSSMEQRLANKSRMRFLEREIRKLSETEAMLEAALAEEDALSELEAAVTQCCVSHTKAAVGLSEGKEVSEPSVVRHLLEVSDQPSSRDRAPPFCFETSVSRLAAACAPDCTVGSSSHAHLPVNKVYNLSNLEGAATVNLSISLKLSKLLKSEQTAPIAFARKVEALRKRAIVDYSSLCNWFVGQQARRPQSHVNGADGTNACSVTPKRELFQLWNTSRPQVTTAVKGTATTLKRGVAKTTETARLVNAINRGKVFKVHNH